MRMRGVTQSFELMIILAVVMMAVIGVMYYLSKEVTAQASSPKPMVTLNNGKVYIMTSGTSCTVAAFSVEVTNMGSKAITIDSIGFYDANGRTVSATTSVVVNPGETKNVGAEAALSFCPSTSSNGYIYVYVRYSSDGRVFVVGRPLPVVKLS